MENNNKAIRLISDVRKEEKEAISLIRLYNMWFRFLLGKIVRMFEWKGLPFKQHELERNTMINGIGFVAYHDKEVGIVTGVGSVTGVTRYPDVYTDVVYAMPKEGGGTISGTRKIGKKAAVLYNTSLSMGMTELLEYYASLMAHADVSLKCAFVNGRLQDVLVAGNANAQQSIVEYYNGKYMGEFKAIIDKTLAGIEGGDIYNAGKSTAMPDYMALIEARSEILRSFYRDIGIRWTREKRGNMTEDEVNNDSQMLLFNISDMLNSRKEFCDEYNKIFEPYGADPISVRLSPEYKIITLDTIKERNVNEENQADENE